MSSELGPIQGVVITLFTLVPIKKTIYPDKFKEHTGTCMTCTVGKHFYTTGTS